MKLKTITKFLIVGGALCAIKGLDNRLEVTNYTIKSSKLPKNFNGFKIAQISDYHCDSIPGLESQIANESPDIIVCTGDMADDKGSYRPAVNLISRLADTAPVYMVTGNHDMWRSDYTEFLHECEYEGARYLHNDRIELEKDGDYIALSGIDDPFVRDKVKMVQAIKKSLSQLSYYDGYEILLFHRANMLDECRNKGFDLILSGHMHGGQIRLPLSNNGVCAPSSSMLSGSSMFFPKYSGGLYDDGKTKMIVNRGLGNPMVIPRLFNRPEITMITLETE